MWFRSLLLSFLLINTCLASQAVHHAKMLLKVEERNIDSDEIYEYQLFDDNQNGLIVKTISANPNNETKLFNSEFKTIEKKQLDKLKEHIAGLQALEYENDFPWKEDYYKRGDVYRIIFVDKITINNFDTKANPKEILSPKTFYYYQGRKDSPELFKKLVDTLHDYI